MNEAKKPDVHAPRFRRKRKRTFGTEMCDLIRTKVPEARHLSNEELKQIINTFNQVLWMTAIEKRDGVEIPEQIGHLFIGSCPPKKSRNVDFKKSAEYLQVIQHRNWESDQYLAKIFFTAYGTKYRFKNHELWGFEATRDFTRKVGETYPKLWKQYVEIDPRQKISKLFRSHMWENERKDMVEEQLKTYNEFEF